MDMECIFKSLHDGSVQIITKFHHIDYERILNEEEATYLNLNFGENATNIIPMIESYEPFDFPTRGCVQVFDELCKPTESLLRRFGRSEYSDSSYTICSCDRAILRLTYND